MDEMKEKGNGFRTDLNLKGIIRKVCKRRKTSYCCEITFQFYCKTQEYEIEGYP